MVEGESSRELAGRDVAERRVRPEVIVILPPAFDLLAGIVERQEPVGVQALVPETAVERFDEGVVGRLAWPRIVERDPVVIGPAIQGQRNEFAAVVRLDPLRQAALMLQTLHDRDDILTLELLVNLDGQALLGEIIHDRQRPEAAADEQGIGHEVHAPALVRRRQHHALKPMRRGLAPARALAPQVEPCLPVQAVDALVVDLPALPPKQHVDPPETVTHARGGNFFHAPEQRGIVLLLGSVVPASAALAQDRTCAPDAYAVTIHEMAHERLALRGP